jgi:hypothetical protein
MRNGVPEEHTLGNYIKALGNSNSARFFSISRLFFDIFDNVDIGASEKEWRGNCLTLRNLIKTFIQERKEEMRNPNYESKYDFLSTLLSDDLFKDN